MTWPCQACTYININDRALRCHSCNTHRPNSNSVAPAIIDLTEICSPNLTATDENERRISRRRREDVMESNRSRRRRRLEQPSAMTISDRSDALANGISFNNDNPSSSTKSLQTHASSDKSDAYAVAKNVSRSKGGIDNEHNNRKTSDSNVEDESKLKLARKEESKLMKGSETNDTRAVRNTESEYRSNSANGTKQKHHPAEQSISAQRLTDIYIPLKPNSAEALLERANIILQQSFKHKSLRPLQQTAVMNTLQRKSSIVVMATGGGKSLCFQLPALVGGTVSTNICADTSRVTIVVCPLIALMMDQVDNLHRRGIHTAACLSSSHNSKTRQEILNRLQLDKTKAQKGVDNNNHSPKPTPIQLLYCTPELIETDKFRAILTNLYKSDRLYLFAIDEAHCLSTWGETFNTRACNQSFIALIFLP